MKKGFITKKFLALLLASAMVITSVPEVALAAAPDEIVEEDVAIADNDVVAGDAAIVEEDVKEEDTSSDPIEPDLYAGDVWINIIAGSSASAGLSVLDTSAVNEGVSPAATILTAGQNYYSTHGSSYILADSSVGFTFLVAPAAGKELKEDPVKGNTAGSSFVTYYNDYSALWCATPGSTTWTKNKADGSGTASAVVTNASDSDVATPITKVSADTESGYKVANYTQNNNYRVVTLTPKLLQDAIAKYKDKDGIWAAAESSTVAATVALKEKQFRPVLTITLADADTATFTINEPTTKGTTEILNSLSADDRKVAYAASEPAKTVAVSIGGTRGITAKTDYAMTTDFSKAKITVSIKDGEKNVDTIDGVLNADGSTKMTFPHTISGATAISAGLNTVNAAAGAPFVFNTTDKNLYIAQYITNVAYDNGYTIDVQFDFSEEAGISHALTVTGMTEGYLVASDGTKLAKIKKTAGSNWESEVTDGGTAQIYVEGEKDGNGRKREVTKVYYTEGTSTKKIDMGATGATSFSQSVASVKDAINFVVETNEAVTLGGSTTTDFAVYSSKGVKITSGFETKSDEPFSFTVQPINGKAIKSVAYEINPSESATALTGTLTATNGVYTTPKVTGGLTITVTASDAKTDKLDVSISNATKTANKVTVKTAEDAGQVISTTTHVNEVICGSLAEFLSRVTELTGAEQTDAKWGYGTVANDSLIAFVVEIGDDWPKANAGETVQWGVQITGGSVTGNGVMIAGPIVPLGGNAKNLGVIAGYVKRDWKAQMGLDGAASPGTDYTVQVIAGSTDKNANAYESDLRTTFDANTRLGSAMNFNLTGTDADVVATLTAPATNGYEKAVYNEEYYFTVTTGAGADELVSEVTYTMGGTKYDATLVSGDVCGNSKTSIWRTSKVTGDVCIDVKTTTYSILKVDGLSKSTVKTAAGVTVTKDGVPVDNTKELVYTIESNNKENIVITEAVYDVILASDNSVISSNNSIIATGSKATEGTYTLGTGVLGNDLGTKRIITFKASTKETVDPATYNVEFKNANKVDSASETGKNDGDQLANTYDTSGNLTSQVLNLTVGEAAGIPGTTNGGVVVTDKKGNSLIALGAGSPEYKVEKAKDSVRIISATGLNATTGVFTGTISGYAVGEDIITATATKSSSPETNNLEVYSGTLPIKVTSAWKDLYIDSTADAVDTSDGSNTATLTVYGTNERTGEAGAVTVSGMGGTGNKIGKVVWTFVQDVSTKVDPDYDFTTKDSTGFYETGSGSATVKAKRGAGTKITVQAKVYSDYTANPALIATLTKDLDIVEAASYTVIPTLSIAGGTTYRGLADVTAYNTPALKELEAGRQTAEISYKVYKKLNSSASTLAFNASETDVATAIADGDYEEITSGITYKTKLENGTATSNVFTPATTEPRKSTVYATLSGTTAPFTVSAVKNTGLTSDDPFGMVHVEITPLVNGIAQNTWDYAFNVVDKQPKSNVTFELNGYAFSADGGYVSADENATASLATTSGAKVVVRTLSDTYLNKFTQVKSETYDFEKKYTTGVIVTDIPKGTLMTLPKESDFTTTNADPRAVFVGWDPNGSSGNVTLSDGTSAPAYFQGGENIIVNGAVTFTAVWAPKYTLGKDTNADGTLDFIINSSNAEIGSESWDGSAYVPHGLSFVAGYIANGTMPADNAYMDPTDPDFSKRTTTNVTTNYKVYLTPITTAAIDTELTTSLFAYTPYGLNSTNGKVLYRPVNITSGYTLGYVDTTSTDKLYDFGTGTKIKGKAIGTASQLKATLTENGTTWEFLGLKATNAKSEIAVGEGLVYQSKFDTEADSVTSSTTAPTKVSASASATGYYSIENGLDTITLEKSQAPVDVAPFILAGKNPTRTANSTSAFTYVYTLASGGDSVVSITKGIAQGAETITPKAIGSTKLTVTMTDVNGQSFSTELTINVVEDKVVIDVTDEDGNAYANDVVTALGGSSTGIEFYLAAYSKDDTAKTVKLSGTWAGSTPASTNKVAENAAGTVSDAGDGTHREKAVFSSDGKDIDTDTVDVSFTYNKVTYVKSVTVKTHYELVLSGGEGTKNTDKVFITVGGERVLDKDATEAAEQDIPAATKTIEITEENKVVKSGVTTYSVDLSNYGIEVTNYNATTRTDDVQASSLDFWFYNGYVSDGVSVTGISEGTPTNTTAGSSTRYGLVGSANDAWKAKSIPLDASTAPLLTAVCGTDDSITNLVSNAKDVAFKKAVVTGLSKADLGTVSGGLAGTLTLLPEVVTTPISKAQPNVSTVTLENTAGKEYKLVEVAVSPAGSTAQITVVPEDQGFFRFAGDDEVSTAGAGWLNGTGSTYAMGYLYSNEGASTPQTENAANGYYTFNTRDHGDVNNETGTTRTDLFSLGMVVSGVTNKYPKAGATTLHIYAKDDTSNKVELSTITLYVNGLNHDANEKVTTYFENGELVKNAIRTVGKNSYIFDEEGKQVTGSKIVELATGKVLVLDGVLAKAGMRTLDDKSYLIGEEGKILTGWQTYENNTYYADPTTSELVDGLQTIDGKDYYFVSTALAKAPATAKDYAQVGTSIYYTNKDGVVAKGGIFAVDGKDRLFRDDFTIVTHTDADVVGGKIKVGNIAYVIADDDTAKRDDILYNAKLTWTTKYPSKWNKGTGAPVLAYTITYDSANGNKVEPVKGTVTATTDADITATSTAEQISFTATVDMSAYSTDKAGTAQMSNVELFKTYYFKNGGVEGTSSAAEGESGKTIAEPEQPENLATVNLFYTDVTMSIALPDGADVTKNSGKSAAFYTVDTSGTVTVNSGADRKKAATAANSLIILPIMGTDEEGNTVEIGEFEYQLPVTYVKPSLKLTSTKGTIKAGLSEASTVYTTVTEKKSSGVFEKLDVTEQKEGVAYWTGSKGNATVEPGDEVGQLAVTTSAAAAGKIGIQLANWNEKIDLAYSVAESKKNVITAPKSLTMNVNAQKDGEAQSITVLLNGGEITDESGVAVAMPKNWSSSGLTVDGIEDGKVTSSTITFSYGESAPVKGSYAFKFSTADKASATFKLVVSPLALDKAVQYKVKVQMDVVTGQKMVLEPNLKGISGEITDVSIDGYEAEYDDINNQIIVSPAEGTVPNKGTITVKATVGGVETAAAVKISPTQKAPSVKISKIVLPKSKIIAGTAEGTANIVSTYKIGGKTLSVAPVSVKIVDGAANEELGEGWYTVSKSNVAASYDAEAGVINVKAISNSKGKVGAVKVELTYANGKVVKKSVTVKANTKK